MTKKFYPSMRTEQRMLGKKPRSSVQNLINRVKILKTLEEDGKKECPLPFDHYLGELEE